MSALAFIVAGALDQPTGGYRYDAHVIAALRDAGHPVDVIELAGRFPLADDAARSALANALAERPDASSVVIDGLAGSALPEVVERHADRLAITVLVHHPLADETGLDRHTARRLHTSESRVLQAAGRIVATSRFTARRLAETGMTARPVAVVEPGVAPAPLSEGSSGRTLRLLCVGTLIPRKGHETLVEALAMLADRPWVCEWVGATDRDPHHVSRLRNALDRAGLSARISVRGALSEAELEQAYARAQLFVLPSHYEGYGMVITEAIAHGLPVVTTTGGALADTLPDGAGMAVAPGDAIALADVLRRVMDDDTARQRLRDGARAARDMLHDWRETGLAFARALDLAPRATHAT